MRVLVLAIVAVTISATPAPAASNDDEAKKYFQLGSASYEVARYDVALDAFQQAYARKPLPQLLFNIGQCQRRLGQHPEAVASFERYLTELPGAANRKTVETYLLEERALVAAAAPAPPPTPPAATPPAPPAVSTMTTAPTAPTASTPSGASADATPAPTAAVDEDGPWLWVAIGGGVAVAVAAGAAVAVAYAIPSAPSTSLGRKDLRGATP